MYVPRGKKTWRNAKEEIQMEHFEMVEKLQQKANVSFEEAKAALEQSDWDLLDALVLLESEGKVQDAQPAEEYTTQQEKKVYVEVVNPQVRDSVGKMWDWIKKIVRKGNKNQFVISRKGEEIIALPITVMVLLVLVPGVGLPTILIALFVGLFLGARYSFRGPDISGKVNAVIDTAQKKAAAAVEIDIRKDENKAE